jgi:thymidylate synthase
MESRHPEYQYLDLLSEILEKGFRKVDRGTGDASYSLFGRQIRFDLSKDFPLLTTKKVFWKGVVEELYWFMSGQNNVSYLTRKGVHIWDDYPYKYYKKKMEEGKVPNLSKEEFVKNLETDTMGLQENMESCRTFTESYGGIGPQEPRGERSINLLGRLRN